MPVNRLAEVCERVGISPEWISKQAGVSIRSVYLGLQEIPTCSASAYLKMSEFVGLRMGSIIPRVGGEFSFWVDRDHLDTLYKNDSFRADMGIAVPWVSNRLELRKLICRLSKKKLSNTEIAELFEKNWVPFGVGYIPKWFAGSHAGTIARLRAAADDRAERLRPIIMAIRATGVRTVRGLVEELNRRGHKTESGAAFRDNGVAAILKRMDGKKLKPNPYWRAWMVGNRRSINPRRPDDPFVRWDYRSELQQRERIRLRETKVDLSPKQRHLWHINVVGMLLDNIHPGFKTSEARLKWELDDEERDGKVIITSKVHPPLGLGPRRWVIDHLSSRQWLMGHWGYDPAMVEGK